MSLIEKCALGLVLLFLLVACLRLLRKITQIDVNLNLRLGVVLSEIALYKQIADFHRFPPDQGYIAENSGQPDKILIFKVAAVRPAVDLDCDRIDAFL